MKNLNRKRWIGGKGVFYAMVGFLSLISFHSYSQSVQPPAEKNPQSLQPHTPPETQPSKDTITHFGKDSTHLKSVKPDTVKRIPPPRIKNEVLTMVKPD